MLPILLKLGPITIYSYGIFLTLGLFTGLYWFWKMGRDEHWDETWIFDAYFVSVAMYLLFGRVGYVLLNPELHNLTNALSLLSHPGISTTAGVLASLITIILFARRAELELWKVLDAWTVVVSIVFVIGSVGAILNGSMPGVQSSMLGYIHPGDTVPRLSGDLWTFVWSLISFGVVSRVRKNFRFYSWYKGEASVAKDGLAAHVMVTMTGLYATVSGLILEGQRIWVIPRLSMIGLGLIMISILAIYYRSGKNRGENLLARLRFGRKG